jgi:hypothetical protein
MNTKQVKAPHADIALRLIERFEARKRRERSRAKDHPRDCGCFYCKRIA